MIDLVSGFVIFLIIYFGMKGMCWLMSYVLPCGREAYSLLVEPISGFVEGTLHAAFVGAPVAVGKAIVAIITHLFSPPRSH